MPFDVPGPFASLSVSRTTRFVKCWSINRKTKSVLRFTEHDRDIVLADGTYSPSDGIEGSTAQSAENVEPSNTGIRGIISSNKITISDIESGEFINQEVTEFVVDARFPWAGQTRTLVYEIGDINWNDALQVFQADLVDRSELLKQRVGNVSDRGCPFDVGDSDCQVNLTPFLASVTITGIVTQRRIFTATNAAATNRETDFYNDGKIVWAASTANEGFDTIIKKSTNTGGNGITVELVTETPFDFAVSEQATLRPGCNKQSGVMIDGTDDTIGHCKHRYDNLNRFGGLPFLPTNDRLLLTPDAKRE